MADDESPLIRRVDLSGVPTEELLRRLSEQLDLSEQLERSCEAPQAPESDERL